MSVQMPEHDEIEVTPAMLDACDREGLLPDYGFPLYFDRHEEMTRIYRAMVKARETGLGPESPQR